MPKRFTVAIVLLLAGLACGEPANPKVLERYKQMLSANPVEGIALERLWNSAVESGRTEPLIAEYRNKRDFAGQMILGHLLRRAARREDAVKAFSTAASLDPSNPLPALILARLEMDGGNARKAAEWLESALPKFKTGDARLVDTLLEVGAAWLAAGDATKAATAWERVVALAPDNLETRRRLANAYADHFLIEPALRHFQYLAEHASPADRAAALQQIAKLHSSAGRPGKALEALEQAVAFTAPGNWLRSELLGQIVRLAQRQNAEGELEAKWKTAAEANPRDLGAVLRMTEFYERAGNLEQQISWLEKLCAQMPRAAEYRLKLARALVQWDKLERAAEQYDKLIAEQPMNTDLAFERARIDVQQEGYEEARDRIAKLLAANPADDPLRAKALQFYQENRFLDRVEELLEADAQTGAEDAVVALANYFFSQRRKEDALAALARLIQPSDPPERQAATQFRIAQILKAQGELRPALEAIQNALRLQPKRRDLVVFCGELEIALRRFDEARDSFARAYALSASEAERVEADSKAFEAYRAEAAADDAGDSSPRAARSTMAARVEGFIRELMRVATEKKDAASWLRVAQWKAWNSDRASAVTFAAKAADLDEKSAAPREFLARLAIRNGDAAMGLFYLRQLAALEPANRAMYLREVAQLELQRGEHRAALEISEELVKASPGDPEALSELATAQERAGQVEQALETWRKAVVASPAVRKAEVGTALLRVLQRLDRHQEAAEWLLRGVDETRDEQERSRRFDELLLHARQHELLPWLKREFEARRKRRTDDYFTAMALGRVLKVSGDKEGAFELFTDAAFSAPDRSEALPELVREAEDLRRPDVALRLQEKLARVTPQPTPDDFLKLAALNFKTGDLEGTEQAWIRAVAKFPRDTEVARRAAEYHQQWGDPERARVLLRKVVALEPADALAALDLGDLEFRGGRFEEASAAYERVMKLTHPVPHRLYPAGLAGSPWGERGLFTGTARAPRAAPVPLLLASGWRAVPQNTTLQIYADAETRLRAISRLGIIAQRQGGPRAAQWIADWKSALPAQPTDALWALYFGGAPSAALGEVLASIRQEPAADGHRQAFLWMALETGSWAELRDWLNADGRSEKDLDWFTEAFGSWAANHPEKVNVAALEALFPSGRSARVWSCAVELGKQQRFSDAVVLGRRVWENVPSQRSSIGREMARWHLALGQTNDAQRVLRQVAFLPADSLEAQPYLALRELLHLTPAPDRAALLKQRLAAVKDDDNTPAAIMTRLVCHLFAGEEEPARSTLHALVSQRPLGGPGSDESNSAIRNWSFMLGAHRQLIAWDRPDLAREMWRPIFADPGLLAWWRAQKIRQRVKGGEGMGFEHWVQKPIFAADEKRARDLVEGLDFTLGGAVERERIKARMSTRGAGALEKLGDQIEAQGMDATAASIFLEAWKSDRANAGLLRKTLSAAQQAGDTRMSEEVRRMCLEERLNPGNDTSPREFALELADLLTRRGAVAEALEIVSRAQARSPDLRQLNKMARLKEWQGFGAEAEASWLAAVKDSGGSAQDRSEVASQLEARSKFAEALATRSAGGGGGDPRVPVLLYKLGRTDEALLALEKIAGDQAVYTAMLLAEHMGLRGEGKLARSILLATATRVPQPRAQMQLRAKLLTVPGTPPSPGLVKRVQGQLRELALQERELAAPFYEFFQAYADRLGIADEWAGELTEAWANGKGEHAAGVALARQNLQIHDQVGARAVMEQLVSRSDVDAVTLNKIAALAGAAKLDPIRLRVAEIKAQRGWPLAQPTFEWIQLMDAVGQRELARETLARAEWLAAYSGGAEMIAQAWLVLGDPERARTFFQLALQQDVMVENPRELAGMARVQIRTNRLPAAGLLLRRAFADPSCREYPALIEFLVASHELSRWKEVARDFGLTPAGAYELSLALFTHFERAGQFTDALALVADNPRLVVPAAAPGDEAPADAVTCARLRGWARRTGAFAETAKVLDLLVTIGLAGAAADRAGLEADRSKAANEDPLPHLASAAELSPRSWEHAAPLAEAQLAAGQKKLAQATLERFLQVADGPLDREAALNLWEKARL